MQADAGARLTPTPRTVSHPGPPHPWRPAPIHGARPNANHTMTPQRQAPGDGSDGVNEALRRGTGYRAPPQSTLTPRAAAVMVGVTRGPNGVTTPCSPVLPHPADAAGCAPLPCAATPWQGRAARVRRPTAVPAPASFIYARRWQANGRSAIASLHHDDHAA